MKRLSIILVIALSAAGQQSPRADELLARFVEFHRHYNPFSRTLLGCPKDAHEVEECDAKNGVVDYAEYLKARQAAMKLFDLRGQ